MTRSRPAPARARHDATGRRLWARARRPSDMVEATRWLFACLALACLALLVAPALTGTAVSMRLLGCGTTAVLAASVVVGYARRRASVLSDLVDASMMLLSSLAYPDPNVALGFVFASLWFRSLYSSGRRAFLRCTLYAAALVGGVHVWSYAPGHEGSPEPAVVFGVLPTMFLTVIVGRHLVGILRAREQAARREAVHAVLGPKLLAVRDIEEIRRLAWEAVQGICDATPGLRAAKVVREGDVMRTSATAAFEVGTTSFPSSSFGGLGGPHDSSLGNPVLPAELRAAAGVESGWVSVPLPDIFDQRFGAWFLLGRRGGVLDEVVVSIVGLINQVMLALRNSEVHRELMVRATLDSLTGLANRASFNAALDAAFDDQRPEETTVLFVDLDDFKDVNDLLGHAAGDELLQEVAARLKQSIRPGDVAARMGGDEFAVLLTATRSRAGVVVAQRIVDAVSAPILLRDGTAHVGASIGVASGSRDLSGRQLMHSADVAMYAAKAHGKGRVQVFEAGLLSGDTSRLFLDRQLEFAVRNEELVVHYQPVVSLGDGRCTAVEALVRWEHPQRGLLYPDAFIESAERSGAIRDIGGFVLRRACRDLAGWRARHPALDLVVHVNVSAVQLDSTGFVASVMRCLSEAGLTADRLVLEMTESVVIASPEAIAKLEELASLGVTLAIDDFGTGYSALTTLRSLPVTIVKIDKTFVAGSAVDPGDRAVTEAVVNMARQMGLRTIAEGVERPDQEVLLRRLGADSAQGFLYLRPTGAVEFEAWLTGRRASVPRAVVVPFTPRSRA